MVVEIVDPSTGVRGALVIDRLVGGVAAGGLRISPSADRAELSALAAAMTRKQAAYGIQVGGAKAGIQMAPDHPQRAAILRRFMALLRPIIAANWSVGPDMNTSMRELEAIGRELGLPSLKIAVGRARGLADDDFLRRYALFEAPIGAWTVNQLRGPAAVKAAVLALLGHLGIAPGAARVAIQGAGTMGGGAAHLLAEAGVPVVAWADDQRCLLGQDGLPVPELLAARAGGRLPARPDEAPSSAILAAECDVLVLAAISRAIAPAAVAGLRCRGIVEAANLALDDEVAAAIADAGIVVVPGVLASAGGSLAVEALYAGDPRRGEDVLGHVERRAGAEIASLLARAAAEGAPLRALVRRPPPRAEEVQGE